MSRLNTTTNRSVKVGTRTYQKLISQGYVDDGVNLSRPIPSYPIEGLNRRVISGSDDYNRLLALGYYFEDNMLKAPTPNVLNLSFPLQDSMFSDVMGNFDAPLFHYLQTFNTVSINNRSVKNMTFRQFQKYIEDLIYAAINDGNQLDINIISSAVNLPQHGPLFNGDKNCVITCIKNHLISQGREDPELIETLNERFENGVYHYDFNVLASKLQSKIEVSTPFSTETYGHNARYKTLKLDVNNNHAELNMKEQLEREIVWVDDILDILYDVKNDIIDYIHGVALFTTKKIYKNKIVKFDDRTYDMVNSPFEFYSETGYYLRKFLNDNDMMMISQYHKNIDAIKSISKHGIHYFTEHSYKKSELETFDLKQAYNNFYKYPCYEGIPTDLDSCISSSAYNHEIETSANPQILKEAGFALIEYVDLYNKETVERWVSIPYVKMLIRQKRLFIFKYGLISRNKIDLNLSAFKDARKRDFNKVVGRINTKTSHDSFTTLDPLIAFSGCRWDRTDIVSQGNELSLYSGYKILNKPSSYYYPHVASYIQFYTEIMVEEVAFQALQRGESIMSVMVDEITITKRKSDFKTLYINNDLWHLDKESKAPNLMSNVYYNTAEKPIKYSNKFNSILQNKGNKVKITGPAGSGKSTISNELAQQIELDILTPTHEAGQQFVDRGHEYETVQKFTKHIKTRKANLLVDECSMISNEVRLELEDLTPKLLLFTGDDKQLEPVEGDPMDDSTYSIVELTTIFRQSSDPEFARKLNILRLNHKTTETFGTIINEEKAIEIGKAGGIIACSLNLRVMYFNNKCNGGKEPKLGSRIRFIKNNKPKGYYNGLLGVIIELNGVLLIKTSKGNFELQSNINNIELAYALTVHKLQGKTLKHAMVYDDTKDTTFKNIRYTAYSRLIQERDLYILK